MNNLRPDEFSGAFLLSQLQNTPRCHRYVVGLSGGCDSVALLHALASIRHELNASIAAIHIDHGLSSDSSTWAKFCHQLCDELLVDCEVHRVEINQSSGKGLEGAARAARYEKFAARLGPTDVLLLAHHQDDQVETVLLNLFKGAGLEGLSGMPRLRSVGDAALFRPLLNVPRKCLEDYADSRGLDWVEDPSNLDESFDRNFIRQGLLPQIEQRFRGAKNAISRASQHCELASREQASKASSLLQDAHMTSGALSLKALSTLQRHEVELVFRAWLKSYNLVLSRIQLAELTAQFLNSNPNRVPSYRVGDRVISRYKGRAYILRHEELKPLPPKRITWDCDEELFIPEIGLTLLPSYIQLRYPDLKPPVEIRFRSGGEVFCPEGYKHSRPLKDWFQKWEIAPWRRNQVPLIYMREKLICVYGHAFSAEY